VWVRHLELVDFRNYERAELELGPGLTAVVGANGQGKSNLMEAVAYLATLESFRGVAASALVRDGRERAVVRAEVAQGDGRVVGIECEVPLVGPQRILVNKQRLRRMGDLLGVVRVTVFSPDDLALVKEGPALRRRFLDQTAVSLRARADADRRELDRILKHKSTLLKQVAGRLTEETAFTLDVWNAKLAEIGERIGRTRADLVTALRPEAARAYADLAGTGSALSVGLAYEPAWRSTGLAVALDAAKADEVRRQVCLVGPHRDELELTLAGLPARTHASQGEQRTLSLALRLGAHRLVADRVDEPPVLVLDDVFSELDPARSAALLRHLPAGQVLLTTAGVLPPDARAERVVNVERGRLTG
jgi:DNA replication and repair protein RecF